MTGQRRLVDETVFEWRLTAGGSAAVGFTAIDKGAGSMKSKKPLLSISSKINYGSLRIRR
jgi:hypothetical protein